MKTAKPLPVDVPSSRRAQPVRQTRNNPPRSSALSSRSFGNRDGLGGGLAAGPAPGQPVDIFPAITHFADAITALPKEIVRHFTLLKEVDAKIFAPEENLSQLVDAAMRMPVPKRKLQSDAPQALGAPSIQESTTASINGSVVNGQDGAVVPTADMMTEIYDPSDPIHDPENLPRRQLLRQCAYSMQEMLMSLDEKNHVIATTSEALNKQLLRLDECFPHIEDEISEEARFGSGTHWAYLENRVAKNAAHDNRSRRDAANAVSQAAQLLADEAAARSDARKQAMLAKRARNQHADSDFDDQDKHKGEGTKKGHGGSKARRAESSSTVGLGITNGPVNGTHAPKRRKVEKGTPSGTSADRPAAAILPNSAAVTKGKISSPRETPVPEAKKRQRGGTTTNGQTRKRNNTVTSVAMSPSLASSPIHSTFAESKAMSRGSPGPPNGRPRARQNSIHSIVDNKAPRPGSSASNKTNGTAVVPPDPSGNIVNRIITETKTKESTAPADVEQKTIETTVEDPEMKPTATSSSRKGSLKREELEPSVDAMSGVQSTAVSTVTTKSGRASKPSTPALSQFPDPPRPRSSRETSSSKRSKKVTALQLAAQSIGADNTQVDEEEVDVDPDELTYCYCNGVSYGEMVACDADGCAREWFHLECVGLKTAPKGNAKWYCEDCKENMKNKRFNGR